MNVIDLLAMVKLLNKEVILKKGKVFFKLNTDGFNSTIHYLEQEIWTSSDDKCVYSEFRYNSFKEFLKTEASKVKNTENKIHTFIYLN
jgi:hypothetical protein